MGSGKGLANDYKATAGNDRPAARSNSPGWAMDAPRLSALGALPIHAAAMVWGGDLLLQARASDWRVVWCPPSRWRLGFSHATTIIHRGVCTYLGTDGTIESRPWARVERRGRLVRLGPLVIVERLPQPKGEGP